MRSVYEKRAQKELEALGYWVEWKYRPPMAWRKGTYSPDFFKLFDLLSFKKGEPFRLISIKGVAGIPSKHKEAIKNLKLPPFNIKEIWAARKSRKRNKEFWNKVII